MDIRRVFHASEIKEVNGFYKFTIHEDYENEGIKMDCKVKNMDDAINLRDRAILFFNDNKYSFVDSDQFMILDSRKYLSKNGKVKSACVQMVNGEPVYFTHKSNL